ncbi:hypothetical protein [Chryseobacterium sp. SL1]|uniref:hypothetical protein n=1 Tax=Chryseobacterium sp. SL1 TaxID=2995159 RepID=UPI00227451F1|nr:hypothetical protein [Chryseobacterium sp. SL1]MCY1660758.1 hypothetical protein [Chryseobacterium sp. SL1]
MKDNNNLYNSFVYFLNLLEEKPAFILAKVNYRTLSSFIEGYLSAIEVMTRFNINHSFTLWLNNNGQRTSLIWTEYILVIISNDDDEVARKKIFIKIKEFFNDPEVDLKKKLESVNIPLEN